jgi:hypothetical protein
MFAVEGGGGVRESVRERLREAVRLGSMGRLGARVRMGARVRIGARAGVDGRMYMYRCTGGAARFR